VLNAKYLAGILLVVAAAAIGWFILGSTIAVRTASSDSAQRDTLGGLWGSELVQDAPSFEAFAGPWKDAHVSEIAAAGSHVDADLALDLRRKGLLWYNTYAVAFSGTYRLQVGQPALVRMTFPLPSETATYDDVAVLIDGRRITTAAGGSPLVADIPCNPPRACIVTVRYRSRGLGTWRYRFGKTVVAAHDVRFDLHTNFKTIDFPAHTLAPTTEQPTTAGWNLSWRYSELVTGAGIGMTFPLPLQPGPLAQRITFWAPLSLLFYVFVMLVITTLRRIELHPVNYLFLAAAFFAFHLLFAYTVDRIRVEYAFAICAAVSMALTISYLRLAVGLRFAAVEAAAAQFFYLILFSYALFDEGYSGLSITIGAIVTLFVTMQLTGRIRWSERFAKQSLVDV
jgi:hypothetical protein